MNDSVLEFTCDDVCKINELLLLNSLGFVADAFELVSKGISGDFESNDISNEVCMSLFEGMCDDIEMMLLGMTDSDNKSSTGLFPELLKFVICDASVE